MLFALACTSTAQAGDSPRVRWEKWTAGQLAQPPAQAYPRLAWAYFGDSGIAADETSFRRYADAGFTHVQARFQPKALAVASQQGLKLMLGTWENALTSDEKRKQLIARAAQDDSVSMVLWRDEADATLLNSIGDANRDVLAGTPTRVLPVQTVLPGHASRSSDKTRFDPAQPCAAKRSYCDFVEGVVESAQPAAIAVTLYPLLEGGDRPGYHDTLEQLRRQTRAAGIGLFGFVLVTPHYDGWSGQRYRKPDYSDVQWQVNSLLAHNAKGIFYYNYRVKRKDIEEGKLQWGEGMAGSVDGQPTETYEHVKAANCMLSALGPIFMRTQVSANQVVGRNRGTVEFGTPGGATKVSGKDFVASMLRGTSQGADETWLMLVNNQHGPGSAPTQVRVSLPRTAVASQVTADSRCSAERTPLRRGEEEVAFSLEPGASVLIGLQAQ